MKYVETFNLGAVIFALLVGLWILYAVPHIAERRRVLGEVEAMGQQRVSHTARDLTTVCRSHSEKPREATHMRDTRSLLRPADPTRRPRFDSLGTGPEIGEAVIAPESKASTVLIGILALLVLATVGLLVTTSFSLTPLYAPLIAFGALVLYVVFLRATRASRMANARAAREAASSVAPRVREGSASEQTHESSAAEASKESSSPAEVDFAHRHEEFLTKVLDKHNAGAGEAQARREHSGPASFRYGALSTQHTFESPVLEEMEAYEEAAGGRRTARGQVIGKGLTVDDILERRRA